MPLTEPSSLETALSRIVGEPGVTSAGTAPPADQGTFNLAPRSSLISYSPNTAQTGMSVNLGAAQPVSAVPASAVPTSSVPAMPVSQASALTSPTVSAPAVAAPAAPQITYEQQLRNDLARSGVTGSQADTIVKATMQGGGWSSGTLYDPTNTQMNINPGK